MRIVKVDCVDSTNSFARQLNPKPEENILIITREQTAGKGQRGNSWEAEPGKNLTFSILYHPENLPANEQFLLSSALSLGICDFLKDYLAPEKVKIKWPNDIYVDDRKICGILIENSLSGKNIQWSILGVGLNINQKTFLSDAPNPVSLANLTGKEFDLDRMTVRLAEILEHRFSLLENPITRKEIMPEYLHNLWRFQSIARYRLPDGEEFTGRITDVAEDGVITIARGDGCILKFLFKEVQYII